MPLIGIVPENLPPFDTATDDGDAKHPVHLFCLFVACSRPDHDLSNKYGGYARPSLVTLLILSVCGVCVIDERHFHASNTIRKPQTCFQCSLNQTTITERCFR